MANIYSSCTGSKAGFKPKAIMALVLIFLLTAFMPHSSFAMGKGKVDKKPATSAVITHRVKLNGHYATITTDATQRSGAPYVNVRIAFDTQVAGLSPDDIYISNGTMSAWYSPDGGTNFSFNIVWMQPGTVYVNVPYWAPYFYDDEELSSDLNLSFEHVDPSLSYPSVPVFNIGTAITPIAPTSDGMVSFAISPALPAGLAFDTTTGIISGTPTTVTAATDYTVTGTLVDASTLTATVNISVIVPVPTLNYPGAQVYHYGTPIPRLVPTSANTVPTGYGTGVAFGNIVSGRGIVSDAAGNVYVLDNTTLSKYPAGGGTPIVLSNSFYTETGSLAIDSLGYVYGATFNAIIKQKTNDITGATFQSIGTYANQGIGVYAVDPDGTLYYTSNLNTNSNIIKRLPDGTESIMTTYNNGAGAASGGLATDKNYLYIYYGTSGSYVKKILKSDNSQVVIRNSFLLGLTPDGKGNLYGFDGYSSIVKIAAGTDINTNVDNINSSIPGLGGDEFGPQLGGATLDGSGDIYAYTYDYPTGHLYKISALQYAISPVLPAGLVFDTATGIISGTPTMVSPATDYLVSAQGADGTPVTATVNIAVGIAQAALNNLAVSTGTISPAFDSGITAYTTTVTADVNTITITPTSSDPTQTITINHKAVPSGTGALKALVVGNNLFTIVVTNSANAKKTYTLNVTRAVPSNVNLSSLTMSPTAVLVAGTTVGTTYNRSATVAVGVNTVSFKPTASDPGSVITVNGTVVSSGTLSPGIPLTDINTSVSVLITGADGVTIRTYAITVTKSGSSDASLSGLVVSPTAVIVAGTTVGTTYNRSVSVDQSTSSISIKPTATEPHATITVNGVTATSGTALAGIPLNSDGSPTTVNVVVTAENGVTIRNYSLVVSKIGSSDASLSKLALNPVVPILVVANNAPLYQRSATIDGGTTSVTVKATANEPHATITINGAPVVSGVASLPIITYPGTTLVTVVVTASDKVTTKTYTIEVNRAGFLFASLHSPSDIITFSPQAKPANPYGEVFVHRTVSPTGDGINDFLKIDGIEAYKDNSISIVNQSGKRVFEVAGYDNTVKVFNGHSSHGNAALPSGTYFYMLSYKVGTDTKSKSGYFVLKN